MNSIPRNSESGYSHDERAAIRRVDDDLRADEMHEAKAILAAQKGTHGVVAPQPAASPFNFGDHPVRVVVREGEAWFVASDVCAALDYKNTSDAIATHLDDDERMTIAAGDTQSNDSSQSLESKRARGGARNLVIVNESGLYALVLRSRKPEARKFAKWVTSEVLPQIRKTGVYLPKEFAVNPGDVLTKDQQDILRHLVKSTVDRLPKPKQGAAAVKMWSKLKAHFGVAYREIPQQEFTEAVSLLTRASTEWELVDEDAEDAAQRAERQKMAFAMAAKAGEAAARTVFQAVMDSKESADGNRWVFGLHNAKLDDPESPPEAWAQVVPRDACIASPKRLAEMITHPDGLILPQGDLIALLLACAGKIREGLPPNLRI